MSKILYFDVETTGLNPGKDSIHQMAGIIELDGQVVEEFDIKMQPYHLAEYPDTYVTPVGGITKQMMQAYGTQADGFKKLKDIMGKYVDKYNRTDKFFLAGYNCQSFDMVFLRALFERNGDTYFGTWFWSSSIDAMILAAYFLQKERPKMSNFKLETVAKYYGLVVDGAGYHDALSDIRITRSIIQMAEMY